MMVWSALSEPLQTELLRKVVFVKLICSLSGLVTETRQGPMVPLSSQQSICQTEPACHMVLFLVVSWAVES